ncbi:MULTISPECIES: apolipoprotein N-acyltransferase [Olivibacter]|uniref:Apolipoprotein N-acyltransferase n=1 Tax=Olivibacter oleidegradans TaxID=760123 RepID=A0ABV6HRD8_9SPHI|nr:MULTISPECIES: apolipoprotein N-acyltransferase [Olivibacter]MDM8173920.1 apolipoprotein N-acyltransferase [Olivibacter sp. 47]QEL03706.1 apolipoprotein N-acyltransferase [Olivibacter sp. LS-1]
MKNNYIWALISAFLLWLGWPPVPYSALLLLIAFVPLLMAIERVILDDTTKKGQKIFLLAGFTALIWNTTSIYWVYNAISAVMPAYIAIFISLIPFGLAALMIAIVFKLYYQLRKRYSVSGSLVGLVCLWIGYEYLHQSWDLAFPWMTLGNGFSNTHQLIQWYAYTGVYGGTAWIWLCNIALFLVLRKRIYEKTSTLNFKHTLNFKQFIRFALAVLIPSIISLVQYFSYEEHENPSNVVVVQPNIDPYGKFGNIPVATQVENLIRLSRDKAQTNTEFFIWPESAIPERPPGVNEEEIRNNDSYLRIRDFLYNYKNGNVLSGIESMQLYDSLQTPSARQFSNVSKYYDVFNAAVLIDNSSKVQFYHKSKLVPGVEQTPFSYLSFLKPLFAAFGGSTGSYGSQEKPSVFYSQSGIGAAPVICYESIWGNYVAEYVRQGAQFIAVITNDGWWGNTSGKSQHLAYAKLRAIENRRWVARAANTGISAFINQRGDIVSQSEWWVPTALKADINLNEEITFYTATGDYFAYAACFGCAIYLVLLLGTFFKRFGRGVVSR